MDVAANERGDAPHVGILAQRQGRLVRIDEFVEPAVELRNRRLAEATVARAWEPTAAARITINGLAIISEVPALDRYYAWNLIGGPGAFLITAKDYGISPRRCV
jgi:hypothetical protein